MPRISTDNYDTVAAWNGSQDLFVVEQPDGTKVATPAMVKQFMEAGDFEATGEVKDGHGNILKDMAKSDDVDDEIGDLSQTGVTGASVAAQIKKLNDDLVLESFTPTLASALGTPTFYDHNCFYNPKTKQVHLQVLIYSSDGLIPTAGQTIFTVAAKYRPAETFQIGMAFLMSSTQFDSRTTRMERCYLGFNGVFALNNFIYGGQATKVLYFVGDYIAA